ncbi:hypothetical protein H9Q69_006289 [Fusarium xylarioides]|uniref:Uncharacterized protein n=1 Tax=Fusarium xylarioides TaxID=221167 RepID=A0A9P7L9Q8_9HYPO|nr:hypothetical protein H9Q70_002801 [Fusarium xylarioides]KAG5765915.1 hypothetical protein H9Q72_005994 [Fusarium xylarioides]KAG5794655.1 hypothetical protein H9Q69_006289 [Fusarium xylarioides]KAG5810623.1 hypothetical protein H9Q71_005361 [Fusarium xylarioides]KAG5828432.1 hypothetical protein H9Q74_001528 [Fusarium xylarioides]
MSDGPPPTPSKRQRARALEEQGILHDTPIDVPTFACKFPFINSKKCTNCEKNPCSRIPAMMNGNYMDIITIFKAIDKMLKDETVRFQDAYKLGIIKGTVPDSTASNSIKSNSTDYLGQSFEVLVNTHALTHDDIL